MQNETLRRLAGLLGVDGVAIYGARVRLRQDDLLVRSHASDALTRAATLLRDLAARYHQERIPPSSREQPFPPQLALQTLRSIEQRQRAVQEVELQLRSAPFPPEDAVWERLRSARLQLDLLLSLDIALIERAQAVEALCAALTPDAVEGPQSGQPIEEALLALRTALHERTELLAPPH
ncbi:MAG: hypothetical protein M0Z66_15000 [Thermaerobacter sp.]|nr:hypothetical protein [Thermaerobacter sp.]